MCSPGCFKQRENYVDWHAVKDIDMEKLADKFIDKLVDRLNGTPLDDADLDKTTLAKPHPGNAQGSSINLIQSPVVARGMTGLPQTSFRQNALRSYGVGPNPLVKAAMPQHPVQALPNQEVNRAANPVTDRALKKEETLMSDLMAKAMAVAGSLVPLSSHAATTPSLDNLLKSVVAGGVVVGAIFVALSTVATFDPVDRQ